MVVGHQNTSLEQLAHRATSLLETKGRPQKKEAIIFEKSVQGSEYRDIEIPKEEVSNMGKNVPLEREVWTELFFCGQEEHDYEKSTVNEAPPRKEISREVWTVEIWHHRRT